MKLNRCKTTGYNYDFLKCSLIKNRDYVGFLCDLFWDLTDDIKDNCAKYSGYRESNRIDKLMIQTMRLLSEESVDSPQMYQGITNCIHELRQRKDFIQCWDSVELLIDVVNILWKEKAKGYNMIETARLASNNQKLEFSANWLADMFPVSRWQTCHNAIDNFLVATRNVQLEALHSRYYYLKTPTECSIDLLEKLSALEYDSTAATAMTNFHSAVKSFKEQSDIDSNLLERWEEMALCVTSHRIALMIYDNPYDDQFLITILTLVSPYINIAKILKASPDFIPKAMTEILLTAMSNVKLPGEKLFPRHYVYIVMSMTYKWMVQARYLRDQEKEN